MDTNVESSTPPTETPQATPEAAPPPSESLADHAAQFDPKRPPPRESDEDDAPASGRDDRGRFARHRAQSQKARAEDVPRIQELTKKWRTEETSRKALEEKYAALEREIQTLKAPKVEPPKAPEAFSDTEPTWDKFQNDPDPIASYTRALAAYDRRKEAADAAKTTYEQQQMAHREAQEAREREAAARAMGGYQARLAEYVKAKPDFEQVIAKSAPGMTPMLQQALLTDERGPEFVYTLASRPELLAELLFLSDGRAVTEESVAHLRRVLASRMPVATTGSTAPAVPTYVPPKPPNPVRTGPTRSGDEPPGDDASLADHERAYGQKRRHR